MIRNRRQWLTALLPLALAACGGQDRGDDKRTAGGEVLPGSVSDAMLPIDSVRSQPPLAPKSEAGKGVGAGQAPGELASGSAEPVEPAASSAEPQAPAPAPAPDPGPAG
jgi:hypothetical protein